MQPTPFTIHVSQDKLDNLQARLLNTNWPADLDNEDWWYGTNGRELKALVDYWTKDYDWRKVEAEMNGFEHFKVEIDGMPIHFMRKRGKGPNPVPLLLVHGWPWTFWDMKKIVAPLADPAAHGGDAADAFDVIVPSLPGYAFSTPLTRPMNYWRTADTMHTLMHDVLGFEKYAAAGGDWGALIVAQLSHKYAKHLYGAHVTQTTPLDLFNHDVYWDMISARGLPANLTSEQRAAILGFSKKFCGHVTTHMLDGQTLSFALHDSPTGLLAWLLRRRHDWGHVTGDVTDVFSREDLCTNATLFWVNDAFVSTARYYANAARYPWSASHERVPQLEAPMGITFLGGEFPPGATMENRLELFRANPLSKRYNIHYMKAHPTGGHFAHYENPQAVAQDIRATMRDLR